MKKVITVIASLMILFLIFLGCKKKTTNTKDEIAIIASQNTIRADSISKIKLTASIPYNTTADKRNIVFTASTGNFINGTNGIITVKAVDDISVPGKLLASVFYTSTLGKGDVLFTATISGFEYADSTYVQLIKVPPKKITLSASAFTVATKYGGEINLIGQFYSDSGGAVSRGAPVKFIDTDLNNNPLGGSFRNLQIASDIKSQVGATYSPGLISLDSTFIFLKSIYLENNGNETNIRDSVKIYLH